MLKRFIISAGIVSALVISGCASVPMASKEEDLALKQFPAPPDNLAGLYVYRNSSVGQALYKTVKLDGQEIGETANEVYFYRTITPGNHVLATESEFSDNEVNFTAKEGNNYYAEQYIKMGVFVGGANIRMVSESVGQQNVKECALAIGKVE